MFVRWEGSLTFSTLHYSLEHRACHGPWCSPRHRRNIRPGRLGNVPTLLRALPIGQEDLHTGQLCQLMLWLWTLFSGVKSFDGNLTNDTLWSPTRGQETSSCLCTRILQFAKTSGKFIDVVCIHKAVPTQSSLASKTKKWGGLRKQNWSWDYDVHCYSSL